VRTIADADIDGTETYYFRVEHRRINRATEAEGRELVAKTRPVSTTKGE
jgi:hypothetical protein